MSSKPIPHGKPSDKDSAWIDGPMATLYTQAYAQFGKAIQSFWFYDGDLCPACTKNAIDVMKYIGKDAVPINAFIYRQRGVLIGYFLCETCIRYILKEARKNPYQQTPLHADIERNLIAAYTKHLASLDA
jgi:hypothetical protein